MYFSLPDCLIWVSKDMSFKNNFILHWWAEIETFDTRGTWCWWASEQPSLS
jgi:hypothetical protein